MAGQAQRAALLEEGESHAARIEVPEHSSCLHSLLAAFCTINGAGLSDSAEGSRSGALTVSFGRVAKICGEGGAGGSF